MTVPCWKDLLPNGAQVAAMTPEQLERAAMAAENQAATLGFGIAAVGNLLACAALNKSHGLDANKVADLGWLLESLGSLSVNLTDTGNAISEQRKRLKHGKLSAA
ncbi:hypothetical protein D3C78_847850 [compost metagenome]